MGVEFSDYLICGGSNNADRKGEYEGKGSCEQKSPKWHLNFLFQEDAEVV
jgi:hypothetical protein